LGHARDAAVESRWSWFASWLGRDAGDDRTADFCADRALRLAREADYPVPWSQDRNNRVSTPTALVNGNGYLPATSRTLP
jgi:hypothetical protein